VGDQPFVWVWDGEAMRPASSFWAKRADEEFVIGQRYRLVEHEERSSESHRHQFAWIRNAWQNLPENLADEFPTPESLRKRALIDAGFYDELVIDAGSNAAALRVATAWRGREPFAVVIVRGGLVVVRTAKSQSRRHMNKAEFAASKDSILARIAELIGVDPSVLERQSQ
jgi:hypothetical protein